MAVNVGDLIATIKLDSEMFARGIKSIGDDTLAFEKHLKDLDKTLGAIEQSQGAAAGTIAKTGQATQEATGAVSRFAQAKTEAKRATDSFRESLALVPGEMGSLAAQIGNVVSVLIGPAGLSAAMLGVTAAAIGMLKSLADDIERLDNLAYTTGLSVAALQALEEAARRTGQAPESLAMGLSRVSLEMGKVLTGSAEVNPAFAAMGVNLRALVADGASMQDVLEQMARKIEAIPDPMMRAAVQAELFGTRNRALATALHEIATLGFQGYIDKVKEMGSVTSDETNKMARYFDTMFDNLKSTLHGWLTEAKALTATIFLAIGTQWTILITEMQALWLRFIAVLQANRPTWMGGSKELADAAQASADAARRTADAAKNLGLFGLPPGGTTGGGPAERPPPQDRILPPGPAERKAIEDRLKLDEEYVRRKAELYAKDPLTHSERAAEDAEKFLEIGRRAVEEMNKAEEGSAARAAKVLQERGAHWVEYGGDVKQGISTGMEALDGLNRAEESSAARSAQVAAGGTHWEIYGTDMQRSTQIGEQALGALNQAEEGHAARTAAVLTTAGGHWEVYGDDIKKSIDLGARSLEEMNRAEESAAARAAQAAPAGTRWETYGDDVKRGIDIGQRWVEHHAHDLQRTFEATTAGHRSELQHQRENLKELLDLQMIDEQQYYQALRELEIADTESRIREKERAYTAERALRDANLREQLINFEIQGNAWGTFVTAIGIQLNRIPTFMEQVANFGTQIFQAFAQESSRALSEGLFDVITGKVHDLEDVWTQFWQSMLRMILDFLASAAVSQLLQFLGSLAGFGSGTGAGAGGMSDMILGGIGLGGGGGGGGGGGAGGAAQSVAGMGVSAAAKYGAGYAAYQAGYPNLAAYLGYKPATAAGASAAGGAGAGAGFAAAGGYGPAVGAGHDAIAAGMMGGGGAAAGAGAGGFAAAGGFGPSVGAGLDASATGMFGGGATGGAGGGMLAGGAMAAPAVVFMVGSILSAQAKAQQESHLTGFNLDQLREALAPERTNVLGGFAAGQSLDYLRQHQGEVGRQLDMSPGEVAQLMAQAATAVHMEWNKNVGSAMAGGQVPFGPMWQEVGPMGQRQLTDVSATNANRAGDILNQVPGFTNLGGEAQQNLIHLGATFADDAESMRELVKSVAEMTSGLVLTNEQADALVQKGKDSGVEFEKQGQFVADLNARLLDTTNGIGNSKIEAQEMAVALASGQVPAEQLTGTIQALAQEHGPAFVDQLKQAVMNLGLSQEATEMLIEMLTSISEMEIVIPVSYDVQGEPPGLGGGGSGGGGGGGGIISAGVTQVSDHQLGGWVGSRRDTVEPGEFVVRAEVARRHGAALEALNAGGAGQAGGGVGASAEELQRWDREIAALHEIRDELRKRPGRLAGARV